MRNKLVLPRRQREKQLDSPFDCRWAVSRFGYEIVDLIDPSDPAFHLESGIGPPIAMPWHGTQPPGHSVFVTACGPWLAECKSDGLDQGPRYYNPLHYPNIHYDFAMVLSTTTSVLRFASQFGMLGRVVRHRRFDREMRAFEPIPFWHLHAIRVRGLLTLWKHCKNGDDEAARQIEEMVSLEPRVHLKSKSDDVQDYPTRAGLISFTEADQYVQEKTLQTSVGKALSNDFSFIRLGLLLLKAELNLELAEGVRPAVTPALFGSGAHLVPRDLLGAIYASFAQETIGASRARINCAGCGKWFIQEDIRQRACSKACKQRIWRKNKDMEKDNG